MEKYLKYKQKYLAKRNVLLGGELVNGIKFINMIDGKIGKVNKFNRKRCEFEYYDVEYEDGTFQTYESRSDMKLEGETLNHLDTLRTIGNHEIYDKLKKFGVLMTETPPIDSSKEAREEAKDVSPVVPERGMKEAPCEDTGYLGFKALNDLRPVEARIPIPTKFELSFSQILQCLYPRDWSTLVTFVENSPPEESKLITRLIPGQVRTVYEGSYAYQVKEEDKTVTEKIPSKDVKLYDLLKKLKELLSQGKKIVGYSTEVRDDERIKYLSPRSNDGDFKILKQFRKYHERIDLDNFEGNYYSGLNDVIEILENNNCVLIDKNPNFGNTFRLSIPKVLELLDPLYGDE
jgi:hypothetical protein